MLKPNLVSYQNNLNQRKMQIVCGFVGKKETWQETNQTCLALKCCLDVLLPVLKAFTLASRLSFGLRKMDTPHHSQANPSPCSGSRAWLCSPVLTVSSLHMKKITTQKLRTFFFFFFFEFLTRFWQQKPCLLHQKFLQFIQLIQVV